MMKPIQIGLLGFGTVGTGVARMLIENADVIQARVGASLNLKFIADIEIKKDRGLPIDPNILTTDASMVVDDPEIDIIIEMIGGEGIAKEFILQAIDNGKHVVTANKALLAKHGNQIFKKAGEKGVDVAYEASAVSNMLPSSVILDKI